MKGILKYIPGFRSGSNWKRIVAILYYLISLTSLTEGFAFFLMVILLPFIFFAFTDLFKLRKDWNRAKKEKGESRVIVNKALFKLIAFIIIFIIASSNIPTEMKDNPQNVATTSKIKVEDTKKENEDDKIKQEEANKKLEEEKKKQEEKEKKEAEEKAKKELEEKIKKESEEKAKAEAEAQKKTESENTTTTDKQTSQESTSSNQSTQVSSSSASNSSTGKEVTTNEPAQGEQIVYWTNNGKSYHYSRNCRSLAKSKSVSEGPASSCPKTDPCNNCVK